MALPNLKRYLASLAIFVLTAAAIFPAGLLLNVPITHAATYTVTNLNDSGNGSLRQAILDANGNAGADIIQFDGALSGTIMIQTDLPNAIETVEIRGETANDVGGGPDIILDGAGRNYCLGFTAGAGHVVRGIRVKNCNKGIEVMNATGITIGGSDARHIMEFQSHTTGIMLNNASNVLILNAEVGVLGGNVDGINIQNGSNNITIGDITGSVRNVISNNSGSGVSISGSSNVFLYNNRIGTDVAGNNPAANGKGVFINTGATGVVIGGNTLAKRNLISGNTNAGIEINSPSVLVEGNLIGTNIGGNADVGNGGAGIVIKSASNTIGGNTAASRNIISGNGGSGILIDASTRNSDTNLIKQNYIGLDVTGANAIANDFNGIILSGGTIKNTEIGGDGQGNVISGNAANGIKIVGNGSTGTKIYGNTIGLAADGSTIRANVSNGIITEGDSTEIGKPDSAGYRNIISANGVTGIVLNGADTCTVANNYIGLASDGSTAKANLTHGLAIIGGGSSNIIGGILSNTPNFFGVANNKKGIDIDATAGNFNKARKNQFVNNNGIFVGRAGAANESVASPVVLTADSSLVTGTGPVGTTIDIYQNGIWQNATTTDAEGNWEKAAAYTTGEKILAIATNATNSTSAQSAGRTVVADITAPTAPTMTADTSATENAAITLTGAKDSNTNIANNGGEIVAIDGNKTYSVPVALNEGLNSFSLTSKDYSNNVSTATEFTVIKDTTTPTTPTLSFSSTVNASVDRATISGSGTEANANVYISVNGGAFNDTSVNVQNDGNFVMTVLLPNHINSFRLKIVDIVGHESGIVNATITRASTGGGGGGGGGGGSKTSGPAPTSPTNPIQEPNPEPPVNEDDQQSMDGKEEQINPPTPPTPPPTPPTTPPTPPTPPTSPPTPPTQISPPTSINGGQTDGGNTGTNELGTKPEKDIPLPPRAIEYFQQTEFLQTIINNVQNSGTDSDGDGISDKVEVMNGSNPFDSDADNDGIDDATELIQGTNPQLADSDGDGIPDGKEAPDQINTYNAPQQPTETERSNFIQQYNLATPTEQLGFTDSDRDGLSDLVEQMLGTDPTDNDSDNDGISDGDESMRGTDPTVVDDENSTSGTKATNVRSGETVSAGPQAISGSTGGQGVLIKIYSINEDGEKELVAKTTSDDEGKYNVLTDDLTTGEHTLLVVAGEGDDIDEVSQPFTLNVVESTGIAKAEPVEPASIQEERVIVREGAVVEEPKLRLTPPANHKLVIIWQSTAWSQTLLADASGSTIDIEPPEDLEPGEHTVTYYSVDPETNLKSEPTQISFTVAGTTAFAAGNIGGGSAIAIALGAVGLLAGLIALAVFFRKRKN